MPSINPRQPGTDHADKSVIFRFADVEFREHEFSLVKAGEVLKIEPKAFRVLMMLLRNPEKPITKEEPLLQSGSDAPELRHWPCLHPHRGPEVGEMRIMRLSLGL